MTKSKGTRKWIDWPVEEMRKWYEHDHLNCREIGERLGHDARLVQKVCTKHRFRMRPRGCSGAYNVWWKGGVTLTNGYRLVRCTDHPAASQRGYVSEHRLVMEKLLGRYLRPQEVVHHRNGDKGDNRPENLKLYQNNGVHARDHLEGKPAYHTEAGWKRIVEAATTHNWNNLTYWYSELGWSLGKIARRVGCGQSLVHYHVQKRHLRKPKQCAPLPPQS